LPEVSGAGVWLVAAIAAVCVGLGAASIAAAVRGEDLHEASRWNIAPSGQHRATAVLVALGYFGLAALIIFAVVNASR